MENLLNYRKKQVATTTRLAIAALACLMLGSCSEFFEKSIADGEVELLSPGVDAQTNVYLVNFLWEPLDDALQYRLQLASPAFDTVSLFHADTTLDKTLFSISLQPGEYAWRVKALNGSSATDYTTRSFTIHEATLSTQTVLQVTPPDNFITAQGRVELGWQDIFSAENYRVQVDTNGFADKSGPMLDRVVEEVSLAIELTNEARYQWRVRAENDTAQSRWSAVRSLVYDQTPPATPVLAAPANNAQVSRPVTLQWNRIDDAVSYSLYVYKSDSTLFDTQFPMRLESTSYSFDAGARGERILWRVRATDRAGNESGYSGWRNFTIRN